MRRDLHLSIMRSFHVLRTNNSKQWEQYYILKNIISGSNLKNRTNSINCHYKFVFTIIVISYNKLLLLLSLY
jgi:hypothetical protein